MPLYVSQPQAKILLTKTRRVLVIGCSGGGKSTLASKIASRYNLELISIDRDVRWLPGWTEREREQQRTLLSEIVQQDRWVIDGSGTSTFDIRLPRTDLVIWMRVPRYVALLGLAKRVARNFGSVRPMMAEGCPEQIPDREFLSYIWNFESKQVPLFIRQIDLHGPTVPVYVAENHSQADNLIK